MNEIFPASSFVTMDDVIEPMESSVDGSSTFVNAVNSANTFSNWPSMSFENLPASTIEVAMETMPAVPSHRGKRRSFTNNEEEEKEEEFKLPKLDIEEAKKQNHSEIEKRRRDKMNTYITELSSMIPMCNAMARKLDKLTILRMAVQHMKTIRRSSHSIADDHYKPSLLTDEQIKRLVLAAADGFVFVVGCDRGRILYVSESVSEILHYTQSDLLGQNWFDILHPKDIAKVKEQLSFPDLIPKERFIDAKTMRPVKTDILYSHSCLQPGARRSFFCRMKCKSESTVKEEADTTTGYHRRKKSQIDRKYCIIHCTGYMKSWPPAKIGLQDDLETEGDGCNLSCLVAVARIQSTLHNLLSDNMLIPTSPLEFVSRLSSDGKFIFVDQRATVLLGYLPQELLGTSCYEYFHQDDIAHIAESHKTVLQNLEEVATRPYRFRTKDGSFICLQGKWRSFRNLWTKEVECLIAVSTLTFHGRGVVESNVIDDTRIPENSVDAMLSVLPSGNISRNNLGPKGADVRIGAGKIGCQIAREVLDVPRNQDSSSSSSPIEITERFPQSQTTINNMYLTNTYVQEQHKMSHTSLSGSATTNQMSLSNSKDGCYLVNPVAGNSFVHPTTSNNVSGQTWYCGNIHSHSQTSNNFLEQGFSNSTDANLVCDPLIQHVESMSAASAQPSEGNDEAAMAVIMSLLEADAGLGGPVDFSGLQWPLP